MQIPSFAGSFYVLELTDSDSQRESASASQTIEGRRAVGRSEAFLFVL